VGVVSLGNVDILVCFGPEVDPYFSILMLDASVGWRRAWFLLGNDAERRSLCLRVAIPSPTPTGSTVWLRLTSTGCNPYWRSSGRCCKGDWWVQKFCGLFSAVGFNRFINEG
jgi:hypothetical protein